MVSDFNHQKERKVGLRNLFKRKLAAAGPFEADQGRASSDVYEVMDFSNDGGIDADELPHAFGEFGFVPSNPIPARTAFGIHSYMQRLTNRDGDRFNGDRRGSTASPVCKQLVDWYEISRTDGEVVATLYFSPYHRRNSNKAPTGFVLAPRTML